MFAGAPTSERENHVEHWRCIGRIIGAHELEDLAN
jgi:hypothetical protein